MQMSRHSIIWFHNLTIPRSLPTTSSISLNKHLNKKNISIFWDLKCSDVDFEAGLENNRMNGRKEEHKLYLRKDLEVA